MRLYGLLITKDDEDIFADWCRDQLPLYDAVVCLDGSGSAATKRIVEAFNDRVIYLHEPRLSSASQERSCFAADRPPGEIVRRFGVDCWVMCCHADEFCYHDPRKIAQKAEEEGYDSVSWFSLHFLPHPDDLPDWERLRVLPAPERIRHYHWGHVSSGLPWIEDRLFRNGSQIAWDRTPTHGSTTPHGLRNPAPFHHPTLRHHKVFTTDLAWYQEGGGSTFYRNHWQDQEHRTGLLFQVTKAEDLFVRSYKNYERCDRFEGTFDHPWNMGVEYRPSRRGG